MKFYGQALPLTKKIGHPVGEATTLHNMGMVYWKIGQPREALKSYNQALSLSRKINDRVGQAVALNSIGVIYGELGQPREALKFYQQALPLRVDDLGGKAVTLNRPLA